MNIEFDVKGNLKPYGKIDFTFEELKQHFIDDFPESTSRTLIFNDYQSFIEAFQQEVTADFIQWIDGSFVTKKLNPKDVDIVTLIDYQTYEKKKSIIENRFRREGAKEAFYYVDAYAVKMYPLHHERRWVSEYDLVYWRGWFSETKKNRAKKKFEKGFIEISFNGKKDESVNR